METDHDNLKGAGDRCRSIPDLDVPRYVKRRLANGLPVPVFLGNRLDYDDDNLVVPQSVQRKILINHLKEFHNCPLCHDTIIETTATNCGHKFCRHCIEEWRKENGCCPVCSAWIASLHRLYEDDAIVESQLKHLSPNFKHRFESARRKRLQQILKEQEEIRQNPLKALGHKFHNFCFGPESRKRVKRLGNRICSTSKDICSKFCGDNRNLYFLMGIVIIGLLAGKYLVDSTQLIQYMWLAIKHYDGKIPQHWLQTTNEEHLTEVQSEDSSSISKYVFKLNARVFPSIAEKVKDLWMNYMP